MQWHKSQVFFLACVLLLLVTTMAGCEGEQGSPGHQVELPDTTPPMIEWVEPTGLDTLTWGRHLVVSASDDKGIDSVIFYVDGRKLEVTPYGPIPPTLYYLIWDNSFNPGIHTIAARAVDSSGYSSLSQSVMFTSSFVARGRLQNYFQGPATPLQAYLLPDTTDNTTQYAIELQSVYRCSLKSIEFYGGLMSRDTSNRHFQLNLNLQSKSEGRPGTILSTAVISYLSLDSLGYFSVDMEYLLEANASYYFCLEAPLTNRQVYIATDNAPANPNRPDLYFTGSWQALTTNNIVLRALVKFF